MGNLLNMIPADRWVNCPACVQNFNTNKKFETTESIEEGKKAHSWSEFYIKNKTNPEDINCNNGDNHEMINAVKNYVGNINLLTTGFDKIEVEKKVNCFFDKSLYNIIDVFATNGKELQIHDFKYGRSPVYAKGNMKLLIYAFSVMPISDIMNNIEYFRLFIHQPRLTGDSFAEWRITPLEALQYYSKIQESSKIAKKIHSGEIKENLTEYLSTGSHCKYCDHCTGVDDTPLCPLLANEVKEVMGSNFERDLKEIDFYYLLEMSKIFEGFLKSVKDRALKILQSGIEMPSLKIVASRSSNITWVSEEKANEVLDEIKYPKKSRYVKKMISPYSIFNALKTKKNKKELYEKLDTAIVRPEKCYTVTIDKDPRNNPNIAKPEDLN